MYASMISTNPWQLAGLHADQTSDGRSEEAEAQKTRGCTTGKKAIEEAKDNEMKLSAERLEIAI